MDQQSATFIFPDGQQTTLPLPATAREVVAHTASQPSQIVGVRIGSQRLDLQSPISEGGALNFLTLTDDSEDVRYLYRHSLSHVLAQAVKRLFPETKLAIGPAIANGFYYDFDTPRPFTRDDLEKISEEMRKIIAENHAFERLDLSYDEAYALLQKAEEPYKLELLQDLKERGEKISFYKDGEFIDLCRGPHVPSTGAVKHFELLDVAGAYWRGDEKQKMLQRIYGTAFQKKEDLKNFLWQREEAKKRDHRKLGVELDLFSINPEAVGGGLILWHPRGGLVRHLVETHCKERHLASGYQFVVTPHIGKSDLWRTSGHLDFYRSGMFSPMEIEGQEYFLKPMNCPFHCHIFKSSIRSYRELPLRFAEWGTVYRYERSGTLHGLTRVRGFTQDDAHLFCRPDQMPEEIRKVLDFSLNILRDFGLSDFKLYLSTKPPESVGEAHMWEAAEKALGETLKESGLPYSINPGDGAFYGPKIDICLKDALDREWQLSTIQFDFNLPERFDLHYVGEDGKEHRPFMIHRALLGSMERFFALLIEHHAGNFPVWLAPTQAVVLPVTQTHAEYAETVRRNLAEAGLRIAVDPSNNTLNYRIRHAQKMKTPFMVVLGDKEVESGGLTVRLRSGENKTFGNVGEFVGFAEEIIREKVRI